MEKTIKDIIDTESSRVLTIAEYNARRYRSLQDLLQRIREQKGKIIERH